MEVLAGVRLLLRQAILEVSSFDPVSFYLRYNLSIALNAAAAEFAPVSSQQNDVEYLVSLGELSRYQNVSSVGIVRAELNATSRRPPDDRHHY
jgi:hypothetical protein